MTAIVSRTCTEILEDGEHRISAKVSRPLEAFRSVPAYVLLGDPGAGKTTSFDTEYRNIEDGYYITARDFLTFEVISRPEWRGKTLFIDGLDEVRAGKPDVRVPFDEIRKRLNELENPNFRLSCREADWLGDNDRKNLEKTSPDNSVVMLRLDPLTDSDATHILQSHPRVDDATAFIEKAAQVGIKGLLENPQSLNMLIAAVTGDHGWPRSRLETFELACREMAREHNDEHSIAGQAVAEGVLADPDQLLDAAGRLCALMLISGGRGFRLRHHQGDFEYLSPDRCEYERPEYLVAALSTKLLKSDSEGHFVPVHRQIAEFLSARHMTSVVNNGLPIRWVIALVAGGDGMIVSELRGLSAWLAGLCEVARRDLIDRDPIGIGLYGDISKFSVDEKFELLESIRNEWTKTDTMVRSEVSAFAALVTPDMESTIKNVLDNTSREMEHQLLTEFVLRVLTHSDRAFDLSNSLYSMIRDETRWPRVRKWALNTFIRCETDEKGTDILKSLLNEIHDGKLTDHDRELIGTLLTRLYPRDLPPSEVWCFLADSGAGVNGNYRDFWQDDMMKKSTDDQIVELLDSLSTQIEALYPAIEYHNLYSLPIQLLARGLKIRGDDIETDRLYDWLGVACDGSHRRVQGVKNAYMAIRTWLAQRPEIQKAVVLESLTRYDEEEERRHHTFIVGDRLYNTKPPKLAVWCLQQAAAKKNVNPRVAGYLLETAILEFRNANDETGLTRSMLDEFARTHESFRIRMDQLLAPLPIEEMYLEEETKAESEYPESEEKWVQKVRESETALRGNIAEPALLFEIAQIYFDYSIDFRGLDGREKIQDRLRSNQSLTDAAIQGLIDTVIRSDVPEVNTVLDLYVQDQVHFLSWPYLAGLSMIERQDPEDVIQWDEAKCRTALALYYCSAQSSYQPRWYLWLLHNKAELVSELLMKIIKADFQRAKDHIQQLHMLTYERNHTQVARHASLRLLQAFPIRCNSGLIPSLEHLLCSAIRHADRTMFQQLIENKLSRKSMNVNQRARWLAAGIIVSPGKYEGRLINFVRTGRGHKKRISNFADFLCTNEYVRSITEDLEIPTLKLLISVIGSIAGPDERPRTSDDRSATAAWFYTSAMHASDFVHRMIDQLGSIPTIEATEALTTLQTEENLAKWQYSLKNRLANLKSIRRNEEYRHPSVAEICQTLKGATPSNAGDLAALVMDRLNEVSVRITNGNTDDWKQYWNEDSRGRPTAPKHEESCRDAILSDLQLYLPNGINAALPEGHYADDKRSDMRIAYLDFHVPVEIKKNSHPGLWSAIRSQLIDSYVREPSTDGYGIYLVFWFGKDCTQPTPVGKLPASPEELQARLAAMLTVEEARKIVISVVDVSKDRAQKTLF